MVVSSALPRHTSIVLMVLVEYEGRGCRPLLKTSSLSSSFYIKWSLPLPSLLNLELNPEALPRDFSSFYSYLFFEQVLPVQHAAR